MIPFASTSQWSKLIFKILPSMPDHPKGRGGAHALFSLQTYYTKTGAYFCLIPFASTRQWSKLILKMLPSMPDHALFSLKKHYRKTLQYFCIIIFASSRQWSKLIFNTLPSMPDHPKGCGGTTPFFGTKLLHENGCIFLHLCYSP